MGASLFSHIFTRFTWTNRETQKWKCIKRASGSVRVSRPHSPVLRPDDLLQECFSSSHSQTRSHDGGHFLTFLSRFSVPPNYTRSREVSHFSSASKQHQWSFYSWSCWCSVEFCCKKPEWNQRRVGASLSLNWFPPGQRSVKFQQHGRETSYMKQKDFCSSENSC